MTQEVRAYVAQGGLKQQRELVRQTPGDAGAWYTLATLALEAGEMGEARFAFTQSVYLAPQQVDQALRAVDHLAKAGCNPEAEHLLRRVLERSPTCKEARLRLGQLLIDTGREVQASDEIDAVLQKQPRDVELQLLAATASERRGMLAKASEHLSAALAAHPDHIVAGRRLGSMFSQLGDHAGAVRCWRRVVILTAGQDLEAMTGLGISLSGHGQHAEALQVLAEVAKRQRRSPSALADLGMALTSAGQVEDAAAAFQQALELEPRSPQAHCGLGIAYQKQSRWHEAAQAFRATEQLVPDSPVGPLNLGLALMELGDKEGARRALLRAAALAPDDPEIRAVLEQALTRQPERTPTPVAGAGVGTGTNGQGFSASIKGDLRSFQLFDVLEFLRLQKKTGALVVSSRQGAGIVRLVEGALTSASAPRVKRLGEALVDSGLISRQQLERALSHQREEPRENAETLGSLLLRVGIIDRDRLTTAIRRQVMAALEHMMTWTEGAFSFHPGDVDESVTLPVSLDLRDVMLKLMRLTDERNAGRRDRPEAD
jgi:tetratricopeptide (TPR) repeat protein